MNQPNHLNAQLAAIRNPEARGTAARKGSIQLIDQARWFTECVGLLLRDVGVPAEHPLMEDLREGLRRLKAAELKLAEIDAAAEKRSA